MINMSHYAVIKRQRYWVTPEWAESKSDISWLRIDKIKYESDRWEMFDTVYSNIIFNNNERGLIIDFWEGIIQQDILNVGEKLVIEDESFTIKSVEKHINGNVTYQVNDLYENVRNYDELLTECEKKYEEYSKKLKIESEERERLKELEKTKENPFTDLVQVKSRWKRFFERR